MKLMIQRLAHEMQGAPGTVFVVGAGTGAELPLWRELTCPRLVLAEAHPKQAEELARRIHPARNEEVWAQAIVANPATHATLQILNNPLYSSLQSPNELTRHYPNLRVTDQVKVAARSLGESIESLTLDAASAHLLVIDAPGQAWNLLSTTPVRLLQLFACIVVRCGLTPLYAGDRGRSDITGLLENAGFDVELDDPDAIHPRATVLLKRNDIRVKVSRLEAQLRKREDEYATKVKLGAERDARLQQITQERDEQATLISRHKAELDEANKTLTEQQKAIADQQEMVQTLTAERDTQTKLAAEHMAELDKITKALAGQEESTRGLPEQIQKLTGERDTQAKLAEQRKAEQGKALDALTEHQKQTAATEQKLETQVEKIKSELETSQKSNVALRQELASAKQTVSLSVKLQTLREADLTDLQSRYRTLLEQYESQRDLLVKLNDKLSAASGYFHLLSSGETAHNSARSDPSNHISRQNDSP